MKGYLRIEKDAELGKYASNWYYDDEDPDESTIVLDLRKICLVADADGNAIPNAKTKDPEVSTAYDDHRYRSPRGYPGHGARRDGIAHPEDLLDGAAQRHGRSLSDPLRHRV